MRYFLFLVVLMASFPAQAQYIEEDRSAARIMVYYGVGQDEAPATSVTLSQFKAHLKELDKGGYNVVALPDVINAYEKKAPLPYNSVVITFDGSDKSVLTRAAPLLKSYNFPFTVFLSPERIRDNNPRYLGVKDIKRLQKLQLVSFGIHPENYDEENSHDTATLRRNINNAVSFYRNIFDQEPEFFAFPNGLYTKEYLDTANNYGFKVMMGQHSGVAYKFTKGLVLPRFVMTENFADQSRFQMTANALPIPADDITPQITDLLIDNPIIGFTTSPDLNLDKLSCYASGQSKPVIETLDNRIEIRLKQPINEPRFRINCTLPVISDDDGQTRRWRWFGLLLNVEN